MKFSWNGKWKTVSNHLNFYTYSLHKDRGSANKLWRFHENWQSSTMSLKAVTGQNCSSSYKCLGSSSVKAVAVYWKLKLKYQFVKFPPELAEIMPCACCWNWQITIIFRDRLRWRHTNFLEWKRFAQWKLSWLDGTLKWSCEKAVVVQGLKERGISRAWRSGSRKAVRAEDTDKWANCMLKHCLLRWPTRVTGK